MDIVLFVGMMVGMLVVARFVRSKAREQRRAALAEAANRFMLDGELDPSKPIVSGWVEGFEVTFRLVTRGSGSNEVGWTECEVHTSTEELDIALRPQTRSEERWVDKGLAHDLVVGEPDFDAKYIVEAAPADLAKRALGSNLRAELLVHHPLAVKSSGLGLLFEKRGWIEDAETIRAFAAMAAHLAASMQSTVASAREEHQHDAALTGYRGATEGAHRAGELDGRQQIAELKALRAERAKAQKLRSGIILAAVVAVLLVVSFARQC